MKPEWLKWIAGEKIMFEVVPDVDQKGITSQWICNLKDTPSDLVGKLD